MLGEGERVAIGVVEPCGLGSAGRFPDAAFALFEEGITLEDEFTPAPYTILGWRSASRVGMKPMSLL